MPLETRGLCPLLQVFDMPTSVHFYRDILEFELVSHADLRAPDEFGWCLLRRPEGTELMLNTAYDYGERPETPDPARTAGRVDSATSNPGTDVDAAYQHLINKGLTVNPPQVAHYGIKQLYLTDPDGFGLCFQWRA